ncbi:MAG: GIY-YIG nuclease family protein [Stenomitos frigidus ULC029]
MIDETAAEARKVLDQLVATPFRNCQPLSRPFATIPTRPRLYAVRHRSLGLLYIGKTKNLCTRFVNGHKAFLWAWLAQCSDNDIRIAVSPLSHWRSSAWLSELESLLLRATEPPYNAQISMES